MFRTSFFRFLPREFAVLSYRVAQFSMEHAIVLNASSINSDVWEKGCISDFHVNCHSSRTTFRNAVTQSHKPRNG